MKLGIVIFSMLLSAPLWAQSMSVAPSVGCDKVNADLITHFKQEIADKDLFHFGETQVTQDLQNKDLVCARDHVSEVIGVMKDFINEVFNAVKVIDQVDASACPGLRLAEMRAMQANAEYTMEGLIDQYGVSAEYIYMAAPEIAPGAVRCAGKLKDMIPESAKTKISDAP